MPTSGPARTGARRRQFAGVIALVVVAAAGVGFVLDRSPAPAGEGTRALPKVKVEPQSAPPPPRDSVAPDAPDRLPRDQQGGLSEADGVVPDGVTVFDDRYPAVARLDPALLGSLRQAATAGERDRVTFFVDSGWRSAKYQERLLRNAIAKYGSEEVAARWVATPENSAHVSGDAVDIGHANATAWLSKHGAAYGLCQIYRNEPWHYELRPEAVGSGCPAMYADPTHDPRLQ